MTAYVPIVGIHEMKHFIRITVNEDLLMVDTDKVNHFILTTNFILSAVFAPRRIETPKLHG